MRVVLKRSDAPLEWGLIEIQGEVIVRGKEQAAEEDLQGVVLGDLTLRDDGKPQLVIGNHLCTGDVEKLKHPLTIMEKLSSDEMASSVALSQTQDGVAEADDVDVGNAAGVYYQQLGHVRHKYIFRYRPKPMLARSLK